MERLKSYRVFVAIVLAFLTSIILIKIFDEKMDMSEILIPFVTTIGILAGIIMNPEIIKLKDLIERNKDEIKKDFGDLKVEIKKLSNVRNLEVSLSEILDGLLEVTEGEIANFINCQGRLFINLTHEIVNSSFDTTALPSIRTKIFKFTHDSNELTKKFGSKFESNHKIIQQHCIDKLYNGLEDILMDDVFNSKNKRFKMLCESVLHQYLTDLIRSYNSIK